MTSEDYYCGFATFMEEKHCNNATKLVPLKRDPLEAAFFLASTPRFHENPAGFLPNAHFP
jgi:hypothetical protein